MRDRKRQMSGWSTFLRPPELNPILSSDYALQPQGYEADAMVAMAFLCMEKMVP